MLLSFSFDMLGGLATLITRLLDLRVRVFLPLDMLGGLAMPTAGSQDLRICFPL